jgi:protein-L-isoaspartate(D-aspartate) O-methyltransferase
MANSKNAVTLPEGVDDDRTFQRRMWAVQRVSWTVFALLLFLSLLGLFGHGGYFSRHEVALLEGSLDLPVTARWHAPEELRVTFSPSTDDRTLVVDARFHKMFSVESVDPAPVRILSQGGRTSYVFPASPTHPATVLFRLKTQQPGIRSYVLGINEHTSEYTVIIFP